MHRVQDRHAERAEAERRLFADFARRLNRAATGRARGSPDTLLAWGAKYIPHHVASAPSRLHAWLSEEVAILDAERPRNLAVVAPRGSAKSTWISLALPLRAICEHSERYIILIADTTEQAEKYLETLRDELERNERIAADYPDVAGPSGRWNRRGFTARNGVRVEALGSRKRLRGRRDRENRPTLIVVDDVEGDDSRYSPRIRLKMFDWFNSSVMKAGGPGVNVVVVGTLIHDECLVARLLATPGWRGKRWPSVLAWPRRLDLWDEWEKLYLSDQTGREANEFFLAHERELHDGADVLWPEREPLLALMKQRAEGGRVAFAFEKQGEAASLEGARFNREWFGGEDLWWDDGADPGVGKRLALVAVDPALGKSKRGDFSAIVWGFWRPGWTTILLDADLEVRSAPDTIDRLVGLHATHLFDRAAFEAVGFQSVLAGNFATALAQHGLALPIFPVEHFTAKVLRIDRLGPLLARRRFKFRRNSRGAAILMQQLRNFSDPAVDHDDGPDALEMLVRLFESTISTDGGINVAGHVTGERT